MKGILLIAALAVAHTAHDVKLGAWNVMHRQDQFEESYEISTAAKDSTKKINLVLSCKSGHEFEMAFLDGPFPANSRRALLLVEADDRRPPMPILSDPVRVSFWIDVPRAGRAEKLILGAKKLGIRIKSSGTNYTDYFFTLGNNAPAAALILKTCPPPN